MSKLKTAQSRFAVWHGPGGGCQISASPAPAKLAPGSAYFIASRTAFSMARSFGAPGHTF